MRSGRIAGLIGATVAALALAAPGDARACPLPRFQLIAPRDLPPTPTVFIVDGRWFGWDKHRVNYDLLAELPIDDIAPDLFDRWAREAVSVRAYDPSTWTPLPVTVRPLVIGVDVVLAVTVHATSGQFVIEAPGTDAWRHDLGGGKFLDAALTLHQSGERERGRTKGIHQIVERWPHPATHVEARPTWPDTYRAPLDDLAIDVDTIDIDLRGSEVAFWVISAPRCLDQIHYGAGARIFEDCIGDAGQLAIHAHHFDGTIDRVTLRLPRAHPPRQGSNLPLAAALTVVIWLGLRRRRKRAALVP